MSRVEINVEDSIIKRMLGHESLAKLAKEVNISYGVLNKALRKYCEKNGLDYTDYIGDRSVYKECVPEQLLIKIYQREVSLADAIRQMHDQGVGEKRVKYEFYRYKKGMRATIYESASSRNMLDSIDSYEKYQKLRAGMKPAAIHHWMSKLNSIDALANIWGVDKVTLTNVVHDIAGDDTIIGSNGTNVDEHQDSIKSDIENKSVYRELNTMKDVDEAYRLFKDMIELGYEVELKYTLKNKGDIKQ